MIHNVWPLFFFKTSFHLSFPNFSMYKLVHLCNCCLTLHAAVTNGHLDPLDVLAGTLNTAVDYVDSHSSAHMQVGLAGERSGKEGRC